MLVGKIQRSYKMSKRADFWEAWSMLTAQEARLTPQPVNSVPVWDIAIDKCQSFAQWGRETTVVCETITLGPHFDPLLSLHLFCFSGSLTVNWALVCSLSNRHIHKHPYWTVITRHVAVTGLSMLWLKVIGPQNFWGNFFPQSLPLSFSSCFLRLFPISLTRKSTRGLELLDVRVEVKSVSSVPVKHIDLICEMAFKVKSRKKFLCGSIWIPSWIKLTLKNACSSI